MKVVRCYFSTRETHGKFYVQLVVEYEPESFEFYRYKTKEKLTENEAIRLKDEFLSQYRQGTLSFQEGVDEEWEYMFSD